MASSVSIDVDSDPNKSDDLQFQDIPHDDWSPVKTNEQEKSGGQTHTFTNFPHSAADSDDEESDKAELLKEKKSASFWTFEYYQQFFDVETSQVVGRIVGSMVPRPGRNYLESHIRPNPDLYGPFWICTTLVFTTAIAGNLANYVQAAGKDYNWTYDFHKVTWSATAIFSYWWVIPLGLTGVLWWRGNPARYSFLEIICIYGYSLAIYIPISLLWVIQISWLQWLLVVLGAVLSGSVLLIAFWPAVRENSKQVAGIIMALIFIFHAALAMGFMLYFFHVPSTGSTSFTTTVAPSPLNTTHPNVPHQAGAQNLAQGGAQTNEAAQGQKGGSLLLQKIGAQGGENGPSDTQQTAQGHQMSQNRAQKSPGSLEGAGPLPSTQTKEKETPSQNVGAGNTQQRNDAPDSSKAGQMERSIPVNPTKQRRAGGAT